ncbi:MAG: class F sortase [Actinomycetota bacterium]
MTAAVIAVVAIAVGAWLLARLPSTQIAAPVADASTTAPAPPPAAAADASASPSASTPAPTVPTGVAVRDASPQAPAAVDAPATVRVPSVGLELGVVPVGVREDGQMDVPDLVSELGWYRFGPAPGADAGSAVLAAHVDSDIGAAPMASVLRAVEGDPVEIATASGALLDYRITSIEQVSKDELRLDALFARDGEHVVRLVTCGGEWDAAAGAYEDNIVVTAVLDAR